MRNRPLIDNALGRATFALTTTGNGSGVSTLRMQASANTTLTLIGDANFYTNDAGSEGESKTWAITSGAVRTIYLKCTGNARLIIPEQRLITHWGNASIDGWESSTNAASITIVSIPLRNILVFRSQSTNVLFSFNLNNLPKLLTNLVVLYSNITGNLYDLPPNIVDFYFTGNNTVKDYTQGKTWANNFNRLVLTQLAGNGLSVTEVSNLIIDINGATWAGASRTFTLNSPNASMANTTQGGIWGDFDGETSPSALATAYKNLIRVQSVTVTLNGITVPGGSGDGTGFPAGFGDWYRS